MIEVRPEFSRRVPARIAPDRPPDTVAATEAERAALARRLAVPAILALSCRFVLRPGPSGAIVAHGTLEARLRLVSAVSAEEFDTALADAFTLRFVPADRLSPEIDLDGDDEVPFDGQWLDLGEATAEQLALILPAYPRAPGESCESMDA